MSMNSEQDTHWYRGRRWRLAKVIGRDTWVPDEIEYARIDMQYDINLEPVAQAEEFRDDSGSGVIIPLAREAMELELTRVLQEAAEAARKRNQEQQ